MDSGTDRLRSEIGGILRPPIDVLLDPSLLVARTSAERLEGSQLFEAQTQATLGERPSEPRLGDLYVPEAFATLADDSSDVHLGETRVREFYRGTAEATGSSQLTQLLDGSPISPYSSGDSEAAPVDDTLPERTHRILSQELSFLRSGGIVMARTPTFLETFRDGGIPTVDFGTAELDRETLTVLNDVGYEQPAAVCAFAVTEASAVVNAMTSEVLPADPGMLLYRIGR